jgi:hypothetical protein
MSNKNIYQQYLPTIKPISKNKIIVNEWDIPQTIRKLSYLVHGHYRYYGKFPSVVAGQILEQLPPPSKEHYVLDNFCGSGTTLVEAQLRGIKSIGLDISWLSVLVSNVKTTSLLIQDIYKELENLVIWFNKNKNQYTAPDEDLPLKWYSQKASRDLLVIQKYLQEKQNSKVKDFLIIAFIGIVRRVSKAFDGEVRPHINKKKKERDVISAFSKKVNDMCTNHYDYQNYINDGTKASCILGNNLKLPKELNDKKCYLVISHPPYLNSFNYSTVYTLEFYWGKVFEEEYTDGKNTLLHKTEVKAHPATEKLTEKYFLHLEKCYKETFKIQDTGSYLAVVIGDCTRLGKLIPVIDKTIEIVKGIGYKLHELNYRTTHYGLGKYAYKHRADYHGEIEKKKDAIIIFKK